MTSRKSGQTAVSGATDCPSLRRSFTHHQTSKQGKADTSAAHRSSLPYRQTMDYQGAKAQDETDRAVGSDPAAGFSGVVSLMKGVRRRCL